jgi:transcriptional regulator with XRE-family HTH domain
MKNYSCLKSKKFIENVGTNIKKARIKKEMKGEVLGKTIGVSKSYISQMENGLIDFKTSVMYKIAEALNMDVRDLFVCHLSTNIQHTLELETQNKVLSIDRISVEKLLQKIETLNAEVLDIKSSRSA